MKELETTLLSGGHKLIIGDRDAKGRVIKEYIKNHDGALLIFDYGGRLYESYEGDAILADFSSESSVAPDLLETLLHSRYGESPKTFATMMQELIIQMKPDRTSNDAYWSNISKAAFRDYIEYLCILYKVEKNSPAEARGWQKRDLVSLGRYANEMLNLMNRLTEGHKVEKKQVYGTAKTQQTPAYMSTPLYKLLANYTQATRGEEALPFDGTLRNPGTGQTNTFQSAYLALLAFAGPFFRLMEMLETDGNNIARLPQLVLRNFASAPSAPLFLCGAKKSAVNQAIASLALMAAACAADSTGAKITAIIPEIERWNLQSALKFVREEGFGNFFTISSFSDVRKLASAAGIDKKNALTELTESSDGVLWLYSTDSVCEEIFETGATAKERRYKLNELSEHFAAYYDGYGLQYFSLPFKAESENIKLRGRKPLSRAAAEPWIDKCCGREKKLMEDMLFGGLPKDLYEELTRLGYAQTKYWHDKEKAAEDKETGEFDSHKPIGSFEEQLLGRLVPAYDKRAILSFLLDDETRLTRKERQMLQSAPFGKEFLIKYFMGCDIRWLYGRVRAQLKKMREAERDDNYDKDI